MPDSRLHRLLIATAGVGLLYFLWRSIAVTWHLCDFEVFWATAVRVLDGKVDFYEVPSPVKLRNFFYPPSAAVLLAPLGLVSQPVAGVVWSVLKTVALALLIRVGVDAARVRPRTRLGLCLITALLAIRPITSDFGNGQINTLVAALAALGCMGLMGARWGRVVAGAFALATAVALKATPGLLLLLPLLQRRWRATMGAGAATVLMVVVLPAVAFGPSTTLDLFRRFEHGSSSLVEGIGGRDRQVSLNEIILFGLAQSRAADEASGAVQPAVTEQAVAAPSLAGQEQVRTGAGTATGTAAGPQVGPSAPSLPLSGEQRRTLWLAEVALVLGLVLLGRWKLLGGRASWSWDLAVLSLVMLLLSPMVRGAHLVILILPFGSLVCRFQALFWPEASASAEGEERGSNEGPARKCLHQRPAAGCASAPLGPRGLLIPLAVLSIVLSFAWKLVVIPIPGFARPYHPGLFLMLLGTMALMFLAAEDLREGRG